MKKLLRSLRDVFVREQFHLDLGKQFLAYVNFALLVMVASEQIKTYVPLRTHQLLILAVPASFTGAWLFGIFLDKIAHFHESQSRIHEERSPAWKATQRKLGDIERKLSSIEKRLKAKK